MTVTNKNVSDTYIANGVTTSFAYTFKLLADTDLVVYHDGALKTSGFTVSGIGSPTGGNVVFTTAPSAGVNVFLKRLTALDQEVSYVPNDRFPAETHERALDRLTLISQELDHRIDRTLKVDEFEEPIGTISKSERSGKIMGFDNDGKPFFSNVGDIVAREGKDSVIYASIALMLADTQQFITNDVVKVLGYYEAGDGGGGDFYFDAASTETANGGTVFAASGGGRWFRRFSDAVNVKWFGAKGDGATDDSSAINSAISAANAFGGGQVIFPPGEYACGSRINLKNMVWLQGAGKAATTLDFSTLDNTTTGANILGEGSLVALPSLAVAVKNGDREISFSASHGLAVGDVIILHNTDENSYAYVGLDYYREGEMLRVCDVVSSTEVRVATSIMADSNNGIPYPVSAAIECWKMDPIKGAVVGFSMKFLEGKTLTGLKVTFGQGWKFSDLDLSGSRHANLYVDRCHETVVSGIKATDYQASVALNYGLLIGGCQKVSVSDSFFETTRHGTATGGGSDVAGIVNRQMAFTNCHISSSGFSWGMDFHTNAEFYTVSNCTLPRGILWGGDFCIIKGNTVGNAIEDTTALGNRGMTGANVEIVDNIIVPTVDFPVGLLRFNVRPGFRRPGSMARISGNIIRCGTFKHPNGVVGNATYAIGVGSEVVADVSIEVTNNQIQFGDLLTPASVTSANVYGVFVTVGSAVQTIKRVKLSGNNLIGCGIRVNRWVTNLEITDNSTADSQSYGVIIPTGTDVTTQQFWVVRSNNIQNSYQGGINIVGNSGATIIVEDNLSINNNQAGISVNFNSLNLTAAAEEVVVRNNTFGDTQTTKTQTRGFAIRDEMQYVYLDNNIILGGLDVFLGSLSSSAVVYRGQGLSWKAPQIIYLSSAPTFWSWIKGDIVFNSNPSSGSPLGWVCTTGGSPGTWTAMADLT